MKHTATQLTDLILDITIRTRAEVEAEEATEAEDDVHSEDEKPVKSSRKAGGFSSKFHFGACKFMTTLEN
jgi:hypothetical protein